MIAYHVVLDRILHALNIKLNELLPCTPISAPIGPDNYGLSSVGRASDSKSEGRGFESLSPCHYEKTGSHLWLPVFFAQGELSQPAPSIAKMANGHK